MYVGNHHLSVPSSQSIQILSHQICYSCLPRWFIIWLNAKFICEGARWYLPSTSYCTTSTGEEGEGDSKETFKVDDLSQKLESIDESPIKLEEMVNSVSSIPNEVSKDQSSILDEDDKDVLAQTFSKSLSETSSSDDYPDDYKKNFQAFFEHEQQKIVQREADEFKR